ncbi:hypothetical protein V2J09_002917 [Rumex salicifolius]
MAGSGSIREPCPDRIMDDIGSAFAIGAVGGGVFHFVKGLKSSPIGERFAGGIQATRMNVPRIGGSFAAWAGAFSATDCALVYLRQKEDPWNSIIAGGSTAGFLRLRLGLATASRYSLGIAAFCALVEGVSIAGENLLPRDAFGSPEPPTNQIPISGSEESVFGRWREKLGLKKEKIRKSGDGEPEILESFNDSPTPTPTFEFKTIDDAGGSFAMGFIGGSIFHFVKGVASSPKGHRLVGGVQVARMNALRVGGSFGTWGALFSASDCTMVYLRQKEDPWNSIAAGATTGAILAIRQGVRRAALSALFTGSILALIEGLMIFGGKYNMQPSLAGGPTMMPADIAGSPELMVSSGENPNSDESFFGRWRQKLGLKREEKRNNSAETKVLESFDDSPTAMPTFEFK